MTTQLSDHAKAILRAIADEKVIESKHADATVKPTWQVEGIAWDLSNVMNPKYEFRVKPEVRSINGVEFGAPTNKDDDTCFLEVICPEWMDTKAIRFRFTETKDRDTAYSAIVAALEGKGND